MQINTKFNIDDKVWLWTGFKFEQRKIDSIEDADDQRVYTLSKVYKGVIYKSYVTENQIFKTRKEAEEDKFVNELLKIGVKSYAEMHEHGKWYYCFFMKNGSQRFWTNISEENLKKLLNKEGE